MKIIRYEIFLRNGKYICTTKKPENFTSKIYKILKKEMNY